MKKMAIILGIILMMLFVEISFGQEAPSQEVQRRMAQMIVLELLKSDVKIEVSHQVLGRTDDALWMWTVKITNNSPDTIKFCSIKIKYYNGYNHYIGSTYLDNREKISGHSSLTFTLVDSYTPYGACSAKWSRSKIIIIKSKEKKIVVADYEKEQVIFKPYEDFMKIKKEKQEKQNEKSELFDPNSVKGADRRAHVGSKVSVDDRSVSVEKIK